MSRDACVLCGARAYRDLEGHIATWVVAWDEIGVAPPHEHETIDGET